MKRRCVFAAARKRFDEGEPADSIGTREHFLRVFLVLAGVART
jgi:hypothetical protein